MLDLEASGRLSNALDYRAAVRHGQRGAPLRLSSPDSDVDLRGCHLLPLRDVVGLRRRTRPSSASSIHAGIEVELVSHDARQVPAPAGEEQRLRPGADLLAAGRDGPGVPRPAAAARRRCITRHHYHHYRGFLATQRKLLEKEEPQAGQDAALRLPRAADRHPPAADRRGRSEPAAAQRAFELPFIDDLDRLPRTR